MLWFVDGLRKLFLLLLSARAKPLFVVVDILHSQCLPSSEVPVREGLEEEGEEFVGPADDHSTAPTDGLVHWLTDKHEKETEANEHTHDDSKKESWDQHCHCTGIKLPLAPSVRIGSSKGR